MDKPRLDTMEVRLFRTYKQQSGGFIHRQVYVNSAGQIRIRGRDVDEPGTSCFCYTLQVIAYVISPDGMRLPLPRDFRGYHDSHTSVPYLRASDAELKRFMEEWEIPVEDDDPQCNDP